MRYAFASLVGLLGIIFIVLGDTGRYRFMLSFARLMRGGSAFNYETLRAENAALKAALLSANPVAPAVAQHDGTLLFADVFAVYPWNGRSLLRVDKGVRDGLRVGYPATFGGSVLAGQIIETGNNYSVVRMVGSPDWQIPVRVGSHKIAGLLVGGTVPRISMLPADRPVVAGDAVIAASPELPYGLTIGTIGAVSENAAGGVFREADVRFSYDSRDIAELAFMVWHGDL